MKRGYREQRGRRFAWAIQNGGGWLLSETRGTKRELIALIEAEFGGVKWRKLKRRYRLAIVWVEIRVVEPETLAAVNRRMLNL